ncbi:HPr kinase/phosphorylase [Octadecabacter temperatus]|uniref:HPr kinase/phosphorylase n=1 Tax=Octadecabacter temperatus TaxID=1458307 RepID=UPI001F48C759|nr:serine/threonine protein kinase [Octadecabacter temperatus]
MQLHASTVVFNNKAVAICGPSGSGKSALALEFLSLNATLLADDITWLSASQQGLIASCPPAISGRIEARGVGIMNAAPSGPKPLHLIVDLGMPEADRIPDPKTVILLGHEVALLHTPAIKHFAHAIAHYMVHGLAT